MENKSVQLLHGSRPKSRGQITLATSSYKNVTLPLKITKLPLLGLKFDPFTSMTWNDMEMMWKWCGNSLQVNINVQAPKLLHPNT